VRAYAPFRFLWPFLVLVSEKVLRRVVLGASMMAINRRIQQKRDVVHSVDGRHFSRNTTPRGGSWNYCE
jgi:hypothetical protein